MDNDESKGNWQAAFNAGKAFKPEEFETPYNGKVVLVPEGFGLMTTDGEEPGAPRPRRAVGRKAFGDVPSLAAYVLRVDPEKTALVTIDHAGRLVAVLNPHAAGAPGWEDWVAALAPEPSDEAVAWLGAEPTRRVMDGGYMVSFWPSGPHELRFSQEAFAEFVEENGEDVVEPSQADLLEIATTMEAKKTAFWTSSVKLSNGSRALKWDEQVEGRAGENGRLVIPEAIRIAIPLFRHQDERVSIKVWLRYAIRDGKVEIRLKPHRVHKAISLAVEAMADAFQEATGIDVLRAG